jgi:hypothetical protein
VICGVIACAVGTNALRGVFPSDNPDCWAYAAFGQYLTDFSRGTHLGLPYVDEFAQGFAQGLSNTRFGSPALLGFLSQIFRANTSRAICYFGYHCPGKSLARSFLCHARLRANSISALA